MDNLIKKLVYAGLDKAEFDALKSEAVKESRKSLKSYSLFAGVMFALLAAFGAFSGIASLNRWYYVILSVFNVAVWLCVEKRGVKQETTLMMLAYASIAVLYAGSVGLTLLHPSLPALTIIVVIVLDGPAAVLAHHGQRTA